MKSKWQEKIFPGNNQGETISFLDGRMTIDWKSWNEEALVHWTHQIVRVGSEHEALPILLDLVNELKAEIEEAIDANSKNQT